MAAKNKPEAPEAPAVEIVDNTDAAPEAAPSGVTATEIELTEGGLVQVNYV